MPRADLDELEQHACPGPGTCAGHFTANTMAVALDCLGLARIGDGLVPADEREAKDEAAAQAGALAVRLVEQGVTARRFLDRRALLNAMAGDRRQRRLDERDPAPARDRTGGGHGALARRPRRCREPHTGAREPGALRPLDGRGLPPGRRHRRTDPRARAGRPRRRLGAHGRRSDARGGDGGRARAGRRGRPHPGAAVQAERGAPRAARQPRARGKPRQARRHGAPRPHRPRAGLRHRGGVHRRGPRPGTSRRATCSSSATRAPPVGRACASC